VTAPSADLRWSGSRLAAAVLMAVAGCGTVYTALSSHVLGPEASARPIYAAAAAAGMVAGWFHISRGLGHGLGQAALGGVSAGVLGTIYFLVLAGVWQTVDAYRYTHFDSVMALLDNLVLQMVKVFWIATEPQSLLTILIGAATAGMYAEHVRRAWD
jgi:hypothetical protein